MFMDQSKSNSPPEAPFTPKVSFEKIFKYWTEKTDSVIPADRARAKFILAELSKIPELRAPFADLGTQ